MKFDEIISIEFFGEDETYDLEVDHSEHSFYANNISVSNSHAVSYSVLSYICAYLLTYYESEWLCSYLEFASLNPDDKSKAISEINKLCYSIEKIDINKASSRWEILPDKKFMPSLMAIKGIKEKAIEELERLRPFNSIYDFWDEKGKWKFSKFNKTCLGNLIKIGAFSSMDLIGEDKVFKNYKHMFKVLVEDNGFIKLKSWRDKLEEKIIEHSDTEDWLPEEKLVMYQELLGEINIDFVASQNLQESLRKRNVKAINEFEEDGLYWFLLWSIIKKTTSTGKDYLVASVIGSNGVQERVSVWNFLPDKNNLETGKIYAAKLKKNDYGFSTNIKDLVKIKS